MMRARVLGVMVTLAATVLATPSAGAQGDTPSETPEIDRLVSSFVNGNPLVTPVPVSSQPSAVDGTSGGPIEGPPPIEVHPTGTSVLDVRFDGAPTAGLCETDGVTCNDEFEMFLDQAGEGDGVRIFFTAFGDPTGPTPFPPGDFSLILYGSGPGPATGELTLMPDLTLGGCLVDAVPGDGPPPPARTYSPDDGFFAPMPAPLATGFGPGGVVHILPTAHVCSGSDGYRVKIHTEDALVIWPPVDTPPLSLADVRDLREEFEAATGTPSDPGEPGAEPVALTSGGGGGASFWPWVVGVALFATAFGAATVVRRRRRGDGAPPTAPGPLIP